MALYDHVTTGRRTEDFVKTRLTVRDVFILLVGATGMWGTQVATQSKTQASIELLAEKVDSYQRKQTEAVAMLQRQIDDNRRQLEMDILTEAQTAKELAELKGFLSGAGVKLRKDQ